MKQKKINKIKKEMELLDKYIELLELKKKKIIKDILLKEEILNKIYN